MMALTWRMGLAAGVAGAVGAAEGAAEGAGAGECAAKRWGHVVLKRSLL